VLESSGLASAKGQARVNIGWSTQPQLLPIHHLLSHWPSPQRLFNIPRTVLPTLTHVRPRNASSGHRPDNSDESFKQNMSSTTKSHEISEIESSGQEYASSVEEGVAGPHPQVARTARTVHVSTPFALSLVRRLAEIKAAAPQKVCAFQPFRYP
jgi:hypothetical protein